MTDATHVETTVYLQVEPSWRSRHADRPEAIKGAKVVRHTLTRPERPHPGTVTVKLAVRIPRSMFLPLQPEAVLVIPEGMAITSPIEVVAEDPNTEVEQ